MKTKTLNPFGFIQAYGSARLHPSTKWLIAEIAIISLVMTLLTVAGYPLLWSYQGHKWLHILGAVLFVGNIVVTAVWMVMAEQSREKATLHFAVKMVNWADVFFTAPGILLTLANGQIMATAAWGGLKESWLAVAFGLLILSGLIWMGFLVRYQHRLIELSTQPVLSGEPLPEAFYQVLHRWYTAGTIATVLPLISLVLMVFKPQLW